MRLVTVAAALVVACSANDDVPAPRLAGVTPVRAAPGAVVELTGSDLCQVPHDDDPEGAPVTCPEGGGVSFGGYPASALVWESEHVTVEVPPAPPGMMDVRIQINGRTSNAVDFTVE
ncbi:MAG: IPT/TIG domain-containing protein [Kofleriaceae bacterium]